MKRLAHEANLEGTKEVVQAATQAASQPFKRVNMPKKNQHRMHAHINPFTPLYMPTPQNPRWVDWSLHYPSKYGIDNNNGNKIVVNTAKYPIEYNKETEEELRDKQPTILDIGCGYGGLMFAMNKTFPDELLLGLEIRDKVSNFVGEKINSIRNNTQLAECTNTAILRTNAMKSLHCYFPKESINKMFFCFADPHFKKSNHRRRIINTALLTDYCYMLKPRGKIYTVTDVEDLHNWQVAKLEEHPMFERVSEEEDREDPCVNFMREGTDEAQKQIRREGKIWHAVFRKRDVKNSADDKQKVQQEFLDKFYM